MLPSDWLSDLRWWWPMLASDWSSNLRWWSMLASDWLSDLRWWPMLASDWSSNLRWWSMLASDWLAGSHSGPPSPVISLAEQQLLLEGDAQDRADDIARRRNQKEEQKDMFTLKARRHTNQPASQFNHIRQTWPMIPHSWASNERVRPGETRGV